VALKHQLCAMHSIGIGWGNRSSGKISRIVLRFVGAIGGFVHHYRQNYAGDALLKGTISLESMRKELIGSGSNLNRRPQIQVIWVLVCLRA